MEKRAGVAIYWDFDNLHIGLMAHVMGQKFFPQWCKQNNYGGKEMPELVDIQAVMKYAEEQGDVLINRAYANWQQLGRYRNALMSNTVELVQLYPAGNGAKNGADIRLALDLVDDLDRYGDKLDTIIIVSGDSDFIPLARKLKFHRKRLVGIGSQSSVSFNWMRTCDEFCHYQNLMPVPHPRFNAVERLEKLLERGYKSDGWSSKSELAFAFYGEAPGLNVRSMLPGVESIVDYMDHLNQVNGLWSERGSGASVEVRRLNRPKKAAELVTPDGGAADKSRTAPLEKPVLPVADVREQEPLPGNPPEAQALLRRGLALVPESRKSDGWINLANVTHALRQAFAGFNAGLYGARTLSDFLEQHPEIVEMKHINGAKYCRLLVATLPASDATGKDAPPDDAGPDAYAILQEAMQVLADEEGWVPTATLASHLHEVDREKGFSAAGLDSLHALLGRCKGRYELQEDRGIRLRVEKGRQEAPEAEEHAPAALSQDEHEKQAEGARILVAAIGNAAASGRHPDGWVVSRDIGPACKAVSADFSFNRYVSGGFLAFMKHYEKAGIVERAFFENAYWYRLPTAEQVPTAGDVAEQANTGEMLGRDDDASRDADSGKALPPPAEEMAGQGQDDGDKSVIANASSVIDAQADAQVEQQDGLPASSPDVSDTPVSGEQIVRNAFAHLAREGQADWVRSTEVKTACEAVLDGFNCRQYGVQGFRQFLDKYSDLLEYQFAERKHWYRLRQADA